MMLTPTIRKLAITLGLALMIAVGLPVPSVPTAEAHQPYCEELDLGPRTPFLVKDPTVSTAFYGTLFPADDVDYLAFRAEEGQRVLLGITIPQIEGQETFAPSFALFGPGLEPGDPELLPVAVEPPREAGWLVVPAGDEPPVPFFEPFSRTSYWSRQEVRITIPATGRFTVAVWNPDEAYGRYVLVVGDREVMGGDIGCLMSLGEFFQPIDPGAEMARHEAAHSAEHDAEEQHDLDDAAHGAHTPGEQGDHGH